jgi:hypothetical protein
VAREVRTQLPCRGCQLHSSPLFGLFSGSDSGPSRLLVVNPFIFNRLSAPHQRRQPLHFQALIRAASAVPCLLCAC